MALGRHPGHLVLGVQVRLGGQGPQLVLCSAGAADVGSEDLELLGAEGGVPVASLAGGGCHDHEKTSGPFTGRRWQATISWLQRPRAALGWCAVLLLQGRPSYLSFTPRPLLPSTVVTSSDGEMFMAMPPDPIQIPPNPWAFGEFWLVNEFGVHRDLLDLLDPQLDSLLRDRKQVLIDAAESTEVEAVQEELYSLLYDEAERGEQFKNILFNSFFAASFALFEHKLQNICQRAQTATGSLFSMDNIHAGSILDRSKTYLTGLGVDFPAQDSDWQVIRNYAGIRNKLMHEGGLLPENGGLIEYARSKQIASGRNGRELVLARPFCEEAVNNLEGFLLRVHRAVEEFRRQRE